MHPPGHWRQAPAKVTAHTLYVKHLQDAADPARAANSQRTGGPQWCHLIRHQSAKQGTCQDRPGLAAYSAEPRPAMYRPPECPKPRALQPGDHEPDRAESAIRIAAAGSPQIRGVYEEY
jgi:hypothetical protein